MRGFNQQRLWSHDSLALNRRYPNKKIRESKPLRIEEFEELARVVARIQFHNPEYSLFFRGQSRDYSIKSGASSMYPALYRKPGANLYRRELNQRLAVLDDARKLLIEGFRKVKYEGYSKLRKFPEICWAILQHYEVCHTSLLDLTHSLRAAASFVVGDFSTIGYVYVLGFPHPHGSISYFVEDELMLIKLSGVCPPEARRPYFQEGFLVGTFPHGSYGKHRRLDVASRIIAKFEVGGPLFWNDDFSPIPSGALFPSNDRMKEMCEEIKCSFS